jgi:hypothetical protein
MPAPLTTTLLAASAITLAAGAGIVCGFFLGLAIVVEVALFVAAGGVE